MYSCSFSHSCNKQDILLQCLYKNKVKKRGKEALHDNGVIIGKAHVMIDGPIRPVLRWSWEIFSAMVARGDSITYKQKKMLAFMLNIHLQVNNAHFFHKSRLLQTHGGEKQFSSFNFFTATPAKTIWAQWIFEYFEKLTCWKSTTMFSINVSAEICVVVCYIVYGLFLH